MIDPYKHVLLAKRFLKKNGRNRNDLTGEINGGFFCNGDSPRGSIYYRLRSEMRRIMDAEIHRFFKKGLREIVLVQCACHGARASCSLARSLGEGFVILGRRRA